MQQLHLMLMGMSCYELKPLSVKVIRGTIITIKPQQPHGNHPDHPNNHLATTLMTLTTTWQPPWWP